MSYRRDGRSRLYCGCRTMMSIRIQDAFTKHRYRSRGTTPPDGCGSICAWRGQHGRCPRVLTEGRPHFHQPPPARAYPIVDADFRPALMHLGVLHPVAVSWSGASTTFTEFPRSQSLAQRQFGCGVVGRAGPGVVRDDWRRSGSLEVVSHKVGLDVADSMVDLLRGRLEVLERRAAHTLSIGGRAEAGSRYFVANESSRLSTPL